LLFEARRLPFRLENITAVSLPSWLHFLYSALGYRYGSGGSARICGAIGKSSERMISHRRLQWACDGVPGWSWAAST